MRQVWEPAQQALRQVLRGAADPRTAMVDAENHIIKALRPPPTPARGAPYAVAFAVASLGAAIGVAHRARLAEMRRQSSAYAYLAPAAISMIVLVFVPFAVGAAMSLFWSDGTRWSFIGLANFADILGARDTPLHDPLNFYFSLGVTALWTVANVTLHVIIGVALALLLRDPML
jgi:arabinogalactan oligomer/maltooligosaccharide transport system permease protein